MLIHYILEDKKPVPVSQMDWADWFETHDRTVAKTKIGDTTVSTVFLGFDYNTKGGQAPQLFQTKALDGHLDGESITSATWEEAEQAHAYMVKWAKESL